MNIEDLEKIIASRQETDSELNALKAANLLKLWDAQEELKALKKKEVKTS